MAKKKQLLKFELVLTKPTIVRYEALVQDSTSDPLDRFNLHSTYVELKEIKSDWNREIYLIVKEKLDVGFFEIDKYHAESVAGLCFYVKKKHQNNGILTDCIPFIGDRVFGQLGYRRIQASAFSTNKVAMEIYDRWLPKEGVRKGVMEFNGKLVDRHVYGILKKDSLWGPGAEHELKVFKGLQ